MYRFETDLVQDLQNHLNSGLDPFANLLNYGCEFRYESGSVDVIASTEENDVISFEAKLTNWRHAVQQAYRRTSFCHFSYVVMPAPISKKILSFWYEFELRGIGLCSVTPVELFIEIPASRQVPVQPWLTSIAANYVSVELEGDDF